MKKIVRTMALCVALGRIGLEAQTVTAPSPGGTSGTVPKFSGASTLVNSSISDNGTGIGIGRAANSNAAIDAQGNAIIRGSLNMSRSGTATSTSGGFNSYPLLFSPSVWDSSNAQPVIPMFELQAEPVGNNTGSPSATLNLLFTNGLEEYPTETGLSINQSGIINFAQGQTFPGTETTGSGGVSGTQGYLPLFTGTSTLGNSVLAQSNGNIGIGTKAPANGLDVMNGILHVSGATNPTVTAQGAYFGWNAWTGGMGETDIINNQGNGIGGFAFLSTSTSGVIQAPSMFINGAGSVGIGTTAPASKVEIDGNRSASIVQNQTAPMPDGSTYDVGGFIYEDEFLRDETPSNPAAYMKIRSVNTDSAYPTTIRGTQIEFGTANGLNGQGTQATTALAITPTGNIGVGTTTPGAALEVNGNLKLTSGSNASITFADGTAQKTAWTGVLCGGDYAESVDVAGGRAEYEPGDVLVVDPASPGGFLKSAEPYSTLVAGIYSTKPGMVGRRFTDADRLRNEIPMAMVGIVPAKVSAENGPVKPGDLLVTSSTPGYVMKGTDRERTMGAVVGKALGTVASGEGMIEVLVSLQ